MNKTIETFARNKVKEGLIRCTEGQRGKFRRMYGHEKPDCSLREIVDSMPVEKLDWALTQLENTLKKESSQWKNPA